MTIQSGKKKKVSMSDEQPGQNEIIAGLGWEPAIVNGYALDLDLSLFMLGENSKLIAAEYFIFSNNRASADGSTNYPGDNRADEGDDEVINIDLSKIDSKIEFLYFAITIDQSEERDHNFGHLQNAYINIRNAEDNSILCQYQLKDKLKEEDSIIIAGISRNGGHWNLEANGQAFPGGLKTLLELYK